jgi:squalene-associated FAD-dependent desaturase
MNTAGSPAPDSPGHVHIVGAGLAGLATAVALTEAGCQVTLWESGPAAGGRCRSYFDRELGIRVDNGNHLLLSGNRAAFAFIDTIGARDTLSGPEEALFPFIDLRTGARWTLRPSAGRIPWWLLRASRRVPGTRLTDYLALRRIARLTGDATVARSLRKDTLYSHLAAPLAIAALNTQPEEALARLFGAVLRETILAGGRACIPAFPRVGLSETLIDPAVAWLGRRGVTLNLSARVIALTIGGGRVTALQTAQGDVAVDAVVLAGPPWVATALVRGLTAPTAFEAIVNVHFAIAAEPGPAGFIGLIGGTAEWVFVKRDHVSVTISAANRLVDLPAEELAARVWPEVCAALDLAAPTPAAEPVEVSAGAPGMAPGREQPPVWTPPPMPAWRVVKEKRATFVATAEQERLRPAQQVGPKVGLANLALAGDWTATGLPATIEGAIRSGRRAAEAILAA